MADDKIAVRNVPDYIREELGDEYTSALRENIEGTRRAIPSIKIKGGVFTLPNAQKVEKFEGIIVYRGRVKAYYDKTLGDKSTAPVCFSLDAKLGSLPRKDDRYGECSTCSLSRMIKGEDGSYSAALCAEKDRMLVIVGESIMPWTLSAPPTSLREVDDYMCVLTACGIPYFAVKTEFKLLAQKKGALEWDKLILSRSDNSVLSKEEFKRINIMRGKLAERMRSAPPVSEEHAENDAPGTPGASPVDENF